MSSSPSGRTRLATMTLDEYSQAGSKDSFTYWIESRLDEMGSIWGGSTRRGAFFVRWRKMASLASPKVYSGALDPEF